MLGGRNPQKESPDQLLSSSGKKADHVRFSLTAFLNPFFQELIFMWRRRCVSNLIFTFYMRVYIQIDILVFLLCCLRVVSVVPRCALP